MAMNLPSMHKGVVIYILVQHVLTLCEEAIDVKVQAYGMLRARMS
jgi:hypothetical protein